jgi:hypothetical protein
MAINLHEKYAAKVADKFYTESVILGKTSREYEFDGYKSIKVTTFTTVAPNDYTRSGTARYGELTDVQDTIQVMTVTQDKAVTLAVDKGDNKQSQMIRNAGKIANLEVREQFVPMFDKYALNAWASHAGVLTGKHTSLTKSNIVEAIGDGVTAMMNANVPLTNVYCYISATNYSKLVNAPEFLGLEKLGTKAVAKGVVGEARGVDIVPVPDAYLPSGVNFMLVKKDAVLAPTQIKDLKLHTDPMGVSGAVLEIRWLFDAFVLDAKKAGIYKSTNA